MKGRKLFMGDGTCETRTLGLSLDPIGVCGLGRARESEGLKF